MFKVNDVKVDDVVSVFLLLTLNIFHTIATLKKLALAGKSPLLNM